MHKVIQRPNNLTQYNRITLLRKKQFMATFDEKKMLL